MNRDEVARVLKERSALLSQPYGPDAIDAWHAALPSGVTLNDGLGAMRAACRESNRVTLNDVIAKLAKPEPTRRHTDPLGARGCLECEGTGWSPLPIEPGETRVRYRPCASCRAGPSHEAGASPRRPVIARHRAPEPI